MNQCIFCTLYSQKNILFNLGDVYVLRDINPADNTHLLFITAIHTPSFDIFPNIQDSKTYHMYDAIRKVSRFFNINSLSLLHNNKRNQMIDHFHIHLISDQSSEMTYDNIFPRISYTETVPGIIFREEDMPKVYKMKDYDDNLKKTFQIFSPHILHAQKIWKITNLNSEIVKLWYTGTITLIINGKGIKFTSNLLLNGFMLSHPDITLYGTSLNKSGETPHTQLSEIREWSKRYDIAFDDDETASQVFPSTVSSIITLTPTTLNIQMGRCTPEIYSQLEQISEHKPYFTHE